MTNDKNEKEDEKTVTEPELSTKEKIAKMLADKQAVANKAVVAAQKQAEEAKALANVEKKIDSGVEKTIDDIKKVDDDIVAEKAKMNKELEPLNKQIADVKAKYNFEEQNNVRKAKYDELVEKLGETAAKVLTGGAKATGTGSGRGRSGASREQVIKSICDDGLTFAECAEQYDHKGSKERTGEQKVGHLVSRHIALAVGEGTVIKNADGTYSRA